MDKIVTVSSRGLIGLLSIVLGLLIETFHVLGCCLQIAWTANDHSFKLNSQLVNFVLVSHVFIVFNKLVQDLAGLELS